MMSPQLEMSINETEGGKKTLRLPCRLEFSHFLVSQPCRLVRVLRSVVQSFMLTMLYIGQYLTLRSRVTLQFIGNDHTRHVTKIEPESVTDNLRRETEAFIIRSR